MEREGEEEGVLDFNKITHNSETKTHLHWLSEKRSSDWSISPSIRRTHC